MYFGTVDQFYALMSPPDSLWPTNRLRLGAIPQPTQTVGTSSSTVDVRGNAHGSYTVLVECVAAGQVNSSAAVNPGALPTFKISRDGGTMWSRPFRVSVDDDTARLTDEMTGLQCGLILEFTGSFDAGDRWGTTAEPSPDVLLQLEVAASKVRGALSDTFRVPLTNTPASVIEVQGWLARWALIAKCGLDGQRDMQIYNPQRPMGIDGGISAAAQLDKWRAGEDIGEFERTDEGAKRFTDNVKPTPYMASYLPI